MKTQVTPPGLETALTFPLIEALHGRRARRFSKGAEIPDGPLAFASTLDAMPLSDLEKMLVLTSAAGTLGGTSRSRETPHTPRTSPTTPVPPAVGRSLPQRGST
jgi:hypothetical protein